MQYLDFDKSKARHNAKTMASKTIVRQEAMERAENRSICKFF